MKVLKFGGSSVASADRIMHVANLIRMRYNAQEKLAIVFSAFGGVTDALIRIANLAADGKEEYLTFLRELESRHLNMVVELSNSNSQDVSQAVSKNFEVLSNLLKGVNLVREASPRTMDYILSFGERNSAFIIASFFEEIGIPADYLDARRVVKTNKDFGKAKVNFELTNPLIRSHFEKNKERFQIVTGFIATDVGGLTTTLGRGGSDFTAAILAGALEADVLEIWTDVDGVLTSNPKVVKKAYTIPQLSYDEAMEMSHFGAKVIYPPTIQPALSKGIPIYIKNTFNPDFGGTLISRDISREGRRKITGVTSLSNITLITIEGTGLIGMPGSAARVFSALGRDEINIIMITQASSEHSICLAVRSEQAEAAAASVDSEFEREIRENLVKPATSDKDLSLIAVIGERMKSVPGVSGSLFKALGNNGINVVAIAQGSSELNISFAIKQKDEHKTLNLVHDVFFLSDNKRLNLFLMGVGLIGGTLLEQIRDQYESLIKEKHLDLRVVGISNSRKMLFEKDGVDLSKWRNNLGNRGRTTTFDGYIDTMTEMNLANSIFIDCTANHNIKDYYRRILTNNISISTANKVAASDKYVNYRHLHELALKNNVQFLYETNVGAGLPIISTLDGMIRSGDKVRSIEAVISGSLSYIFNNYSPDKSFKELILAAREKGYTEPDPRDDLSGQDIKRKIIILARVAGHPIESEDVEVQDLLPSECMAAETIDEFLNELDNHDEHFRQMIEEAYRENSKLRYIASFENGKAAINLRKVTQDNPFYNLASTDNMIVFYTERYNERPLVIQGPGAGADVTAAGVFAEIIQLGNAVV